MIIDFGWEWLADSTHWYTYRAKVFGGWVVRHLEWDTEKKGMPQPLTVAMVFIPDPNHEWEIEEE
jgi:hypothetical protein